MKDLFGKEATPIKEPKPYKGRSRAHPYPPGSGKEGESCGSCRKAVKTTYHDRNYYKCRYMKHAWSNGLGTDIRLKDPACFLWKPKIKEGKND